MSPKSYTPSSIMNCFPFEIIYARKADSDLRASIVSVPTYVPYSKCNVTTLKQTVGLCVEAYRLNIPYGLRNLVVNDLEVKALLQTVHTIAANLFEQKYPWKGKSNVGKREVKQSHNELVIHTGGVIQQKINDLFSLFETGQERSFPISYYAPIEFSSVTNEFSYQYFIIYANGQVETDITLGDSATTVKQMCSAPAAVDLVTFNDPRLITTDSKVNTAFHRNLGEGYFHEDDYSVTLHQQYPWLKDFLLTYLSQVVHSIPGNYLQFISASMLESLQNDSSYLEEVQKNFKPNTASYKEALQKKRQQLLATSLQTKESRLSQIIQFILCNLDAVPINQSEISLFNHSNIRGRNFSKIIPESKDTTLEKTVSSAKVEVKVENKIKEGSKKNNGISSGTSSDDDGNLLDYSQFLPVSEKIVGNEEMLLSYKTRRKRKMAFLIAESKKLNQNRNNPVAMFRKQSKPANSSEQGPPLSAVNRQSLKQKRESSSSLYHTGSFGDGMPDTAKAMNDLYGIHPLPKRRKVIVPKVLPASSSSSKRTPEMEFVSKYPTSLPVDVHPVNLGLNGFIREMMTDKISSYLTQSKTALSQYHYYENIFDATALSAITTFAEESIHELLLLWKRTQTPLIFSTSSLQSEIYTQLNNRPTNVSSVESLQSVLEELFQKNLNSYKEFIEETKMEFIHLMDTQSNNPSPRRNSSVVNNGHSYQVVNLSKRNVSINEKDYESADLHLPMLSDAKRQMVGGKRVNFANWPDYLLPKKQEVQELTKAISEPSTVNEEHQFNSVDELVEEVHVEDEIHKEELHFSVFL